jgi:uncharacterized protein
MKNMINWFEILVNDFDRAQQFYENVLDLKLEVVEMLGMKMGMMPYDESSVGGSIVKSKSHKVSPAGVVIYLNGNPDLSVSLERVEKAGGKIIMPKTHISDDIGYMAFFTDTEGNSLAFHSQL